MAGEIIAIFELELVLPALLRRAGRCKALDARVAQNGRAELFVCQNAGFFLRDTRRDCGFESLVNDLFGIGDLCRLPLAQRRLPTEEARLEGGAMIERQDVEPAVIASRHQASPLRLR